MPDPANPLIERVRESLAGTHDLLGDIGIDEQGVPLYLARETNSGKLVGISVTQDDAHGDEYSVEVRRTLGETVSVQGSVCPECNTPLPDLERFCFQCGADLSGVIAADGTPEATRVLAALAEATAGRFEILGRMDREGRAGFVYFARDLATRRITALRVRRAEAADAVQAEYVVKQTQVFRVPAAAVQKRVAAPDVVPRAAAAYAAGPVAANAYAAPPAIPAASDPPNLAGAASSDPNAPSGAPGAGLRIGIIAAAAVAVLAVIGYVATRGDSPKAVPVAANPATTAPAVPTSDTAAASAVAPPPVASPSPTATAADSGTIRIDGVLPANARVTLDGAVVRGRVLRVKAGSHQLAVSAGSMQPVSKKLTVPPAGTVTWEPKLVAVPSVASSASVPTAAADVKPRGASQCKALVKREDWNAAFMQCGTDAIDGDIAAAGQLGRMYVQGLGTKKNPKEAITWLTMAAQGNDHDAQVQLGYALRDGVGTSRDKAQAAKWFKQAGDGGDGTGAMEYGVLLERGDGVPRDLVAARAAYKKAAEHGNAVGARRLALMTEGGEGGPKSDPDAAIAYQRAATLGDAESALILGRWYRDGRGVAKSTEQALVWFKRAAELGNGDAKKEIRRLEPGA